MKKFKSKHKRKISFFKITFFLTLIYFFYYFFSNILFNFKLANSNQEFLSHMLQNSNYQFDNHFSLSKIVKQLFEDDNINEKKLLESTFHYDYFEEEIEAFDDEEIGTKSEYVYDPNPSIIKNPVVYIYNTHQLESYDNTGYSDYNITPNVLMSAYMLKEKLIKLGVPTIIETSNITEFMNINNMSYYQSYDASRFYVAEALKEYPSLKLVIDLHRDAIDKRSSTILIDNKSYAKVLFVVGTEHENYKENLILADTLNQIIKSKYPNISRGVLTKSGKNVNGIYNQDLSNKSVLIECGAYENTMEEVINTLEILAEAIKEYIE